MGAAEALPLLDDHLRCFVVVLENASKSLPGHDWNGVICGCRQRCDEFIVETLVVPLCVMASCARTRSIGIVFYTEKVANPMDSMDGDVAAEQRAHDKPLRRAEGRSSQRR